jgi:hypothetical protein
MLVITGDTASPRFLQLADGVNRRMLIEGAIMLTDTVESIVVPQIQSAIAQGP